MLLSPAQANQTPPIRYPGSPLQPGQIRLIGRLPGAWSEPVRCRLFNALHTTAEYQALSYVWGSRYVTRQIVVNNRPYPVTINLESALRRLRELHKDGIVLWVDALCIDQDNTDERTQQVLLMGQIYRRCKKVVVFLGDRLDGTRKTEDNPPTVARLTSLPSHGELGSTQQEGEAADQDVQVLHVFRLLQRLSVNAHLDQVAGLDLSPQHRLLQSELAIYEGIFGDTQRTP